MDVFSRISLSDCAFELSRNNTVFFLWLMAQPLIKHYILVLPESFNIYIKALDL